MSDRELYEKAKKRITKINKGIITDADIVAKMEKEIMYYREQISKLNESIENKSINTNSKELEIFLLTGFSLEELINNIKSASVILIYK